jgi:hypothetical protein
MRKKSQQTRKGVKSAKGSATIELSTPIPSPWLIATLTAGGYPDQSPAQRAIYEAAGGWEAKQKLDKLYLLLPLYGIAPNDPNCWLYLALRLAEERYEGFKVGVPNGRGRPKGTRDADRFDLYLDVEVERRAEGCSIKEACVRLSNRKGGKWRKRPANSLATRYHELKKKLPKQSVKDTVSSSKLVPFLEAAAKRVEALSTTTNP